MKRQLRLLAIIVTGSLALLAAQGRGSRQVEWLYYGGDPANTKYSPLADVTVQNVERLQIAWQWRHWETPLGQYGTTPGFFESTPLMIDGVLYVTTPYNSIAALDAETGKNCGGSMAKRTSWARFCRRAGGSFAAPRSGVRAGGCSFS